MSNVWPPPQPQYSQGGWGPPPPKKRSRVKIVLVSVLAFVLLWIGAGTTVVLIQNHRKADSSHVAGQPTVPVVQPTASTRTPGPVQPTTKQSTGPSADDITARNRLYATAAMPSVGCRESGSPLDNQAHVLAYYRVLKACLDRSWPSIVKASGHQFSTPGLVAWVSQVDTPCGVQSGIVSFYCPSNQTLYLSVDEVVGIWRKYPDSYGRLLSRLWATSVISHEYGHHIQELTGIFDAAYPDGQAVSTETTRRIELQASCLGQEFVSANKTSYPIPGKVRSDWRWRVISIPAHGSPANQKYWMTRSYASPKAGSCNTFAAPAARAG